MIFLEFAQARNFIAVTRNFVASPSPGKLAAACRSNSSSNLVQQPWSSNDTQRNRQPARTPRRAVLAPLVAACGGFDACARCLDEKTESICHKDVNHGSYSHVTGCSPVCPAWPRGQSAWGAEPDTGSFPGGDLSDAARSGVLSGGGAGSFSFAAPVDPQWVDTFSRRVRLWLSISTPPGQARRWWAVGDYRWNSPAHDRSAITTSRSNRAGASRGYRSGAANRRRGIPAARPAGRSDP